MAVPSYLNLRPEQAADLIARASAGATHMVPLLREMAAGRVGIMFAPRGADQIDLACLERHGLPVVVILQDDDHAASGPDGFPVARKILRWARGLVLHATGGEPWHYQVAADLAMALRSVALVETSTSKIGAWADLARRAAMPRSHIGCTFIPPGGGSHPVMPEVLQ